MYSILNVKQFYNDIFNEFTRYFLGENLNFKHEQCSILGAFSISFKLIWECIAILEDSNLD